MSFWSVLKDFGSKILHGVTSAAKWVAPVLHKVMCAVSGPLGAINPTASMIARRIDVAAGMANKFLNRFNKLFNTKNFGSKILSGVKYSTGYVPNTLAKLLASTQMRSDASLINIVYLGIVRVNLLSNTLPLKVNVFPSADIYNPLFGIATSAHLCIVKPNGFYQNPEFGEQIDHYPDIAPTQLDEQPKYIELSPSSTGLPIFIPSSQEVDVGLIYILPE
ncbi:MAG: hypothetical protein EZS28_026734, partial [Streblomastix strix]